MNSEFLFKPSIKRWGRDLSIGAMSKNIKILTHESVREFIKNKLIKYFNFNEFNADSYVKNLSPIYLNEIIAKILRKRNI